MYSPIIAYHEIRASIIPSKKILAELYFDGISQTEFQKSVKIPRKIPRNSVSAEFRGTEFRVTEFRGTEFSGKTRTEFLENSGGIP